MKRGVPRHYLTGEISALEIYTVKKNWDEKAELAKNKIEKFFNAEIMGNNYMNHFYQKLHK